MNALNLRLLAVLCLCLSAVAHAQEPQFETGTLSVQQARTDQWFTHTFEEAFAAPPVVVLGPPSRRGSDPSTMRVRSVTATSFEYQLDEWDYRDGPHIQETFSFLAMEAGVHQVGTLTIEALRLPNVGFRNTAAAFSADFAEAPVLLTQVTSAVNFQGSTTDTVALSPRVAALSPNALQVYVRPQELFPDPRGRIQGEEVSVIAISRGVGFLGDFRIQAVRTPNAVAAPAYDVAFGESFQNAHLLASIQTNRGGDTCALRFLSRSDEGFRVTLEEEQSNDAEINHIPESIGYLVLGESPLDTDPKLQVLSLTSNQAAPDSWTTVAFDETYENPVVVMGPPSFRGGDPSTLRVRNVTSDGFEYQIDEWDYRDGWHTTETFAAMVMEAGVYEIDGLRWEAGVKDGVTDSASRVGFQRPFPALPIVLSQVASSNDPAAVTERVSPITVNGFNARLYEEEGSADPAHAAETLHFIAIEPGSGSLNGNPFVAASTAEEITGGFTRIQFPGVFTDPLFLADLQSFNEKDPTALRHNELTATSVVLRAEEEQSGDSETTHAAETVGYFVLSTTADTDSDGLPDAWEIANGLDPADPADAGQDPDGDGFTNLEEYLNGTDPNTSSRVTLTARTITSDAFESTESRARIRISLDAPASEPLRLFFTMGTSDNPAQAPSTPADYIVETSNGTAIDGLINLPANANRFDVYIRPVADDIVEFPETVTLTLSSHPDYDLGARASASVLIKDAENIPENEKLYLGRFSPERGAQTSASGISTLYLSGDNTTARVSSSFSGLTTAQTAAHIHYANAAGPDTLSGPILESIPLGQVVNHEWSIRATAGFSVTEIIDAITNANGLHVYINAHSSTYPAGEIWAAYRPSDGTLEFEPPADPPALEPATGRELRRDVARFLTQATFGVRPGDVTRLVQSIQNDHGGDRIAGFEAWIDDQFQLDQTNLYDYTFAADAQEWDLIGKSPDNPGGNPQPRHQNRRRGWWTITSQAHDQLRQRVGFALSEIFVVSELEGQVRNKHYGAAKFYDMLCNRADDSYRVLLEDVSKSPIMGKYLSHLKNQKAVLDNNGEAIISPDENYAREIMQLFSIGLLELYPDGSIRLDESGNPISTYDQNDITELSRVFTGWSFGSANGRRDDGYPVVQNNNFNRGNGPQYFQAAWENPMRNFAQFHDEESKSYLGLTVPAGLSGEQDLDRALDHLANHPNTAPFICRLLIQRLVTSNPSRGYIYRVAQRFNSSGGNIGETVKAILLDYEARSLTAAALPGYGKLKEPMITLTQLHRAFQSGSSLPLADLSAFGYPSGQLNNFRAGATRFRYQDRSALLTQSPLKAPSVFNWFLPNYAPTGQLTQLGLVAPELQLVTETTAVSRINYLRDLTDFDRGHTANPLPGQTDRTLDDIKLNLAPHVAFYDDRIASGATPEAAATALVDRLDELLMAGNFRRDYLNAAAPTPRSEVIATVAAYSRDTTRRIREAIYLITTSPAFLTQK